MFWTLLFAFIALMVGWATPQPAWAAKLTTAITSKFSTKTESEEPPNDFE